MFFWRKSVQIHNKKPSAEKATPLQWKLHPKVEISSTINAPYVMNIALKRIEMNTLIAPYSLHRVMWGWMRGGGAPPVPTLTLNLETVQYLKWNCSLIIWINILTIQKFKFNRTLEIKSKVFLIIGTKVKTCYEVDLVAEHLNNPIQR